MGRRLERCREIVRSGVRMERRMMGGDEIGKGVGTQGYVKGRTDKWFREGGRRDVVIDGRGFRCKDKKKDGMAGLAFGGGVS